MMRLGILGTAEIARTVVRAARHVDGLEVCTVASRDLSKAQAWAAENGIAKSFGSYGELLRSGDVDAIYNPLPNSLHAEWTIAALEAGLPVLCEKPLAVNADEARTMAAAAERAGLPLVEAFMYRVHPQWDVVRSLIDGGAVGKIKALHSQFTFNLDDPSANPASAALAGGALMDVGCYCVNFSRLVCGTEPVRVSAFAHGDDVDETIVGLMEFPRGVLAHFEASIASAERYRAEIAGENGSILVESPWIPGDNPGRVVLRDREGKERITTVPPADSYALELIDFLAVCRGEKSPRWPIADAIANMEAIDRLREAAASSR
ncbi:MAG: Gfo/Idh/MocA family oxidoreductase [Deltaproteobacteria bacterium]|nr:Gfo/Idh/MocA family oxidoreductase [Deltaproteobacteria bacterium]